MTHPETATPQNRHQRGRKAKIAADPADPSTAPAAPPPQVAADHAATEQRYVNRAQLREIYPTSDMTLWRWSRNSSVAFPPPVKLGADGRNYRWLPDLRAWDRRRRERQIQRSAGGRHTAPAPPAETEAQPKVDGPRKPGRRPSRAAR
jgi:predicted DNA-binding transcriptional regulator AlpA